MSDATSDRIPAVPPAQDATVTPAHPEDDYEIGWVRAVLSGLAILVVGLAGTVYAANRILTKALALRRAPREWIATGVFFFALIVLAYILRRLQARKLI